MNFEKSQNWELLFKTYRHLLIRPIEEERDRLRLLVNSKNIFHIIRRPISKMRLERLENMLFEEYKTSACLFLGSKGNV